MNTSQQGQQAVAVSRAVAAGHPVTLLTWDPGFEPWDSGFTAATAAEGYDTELTGATHLDCIIGDPGLAAGLTLARRHGAAILIDGQWTALDDDR